jgi:hypothetical protein
MTKAEFLRRVPYKITHRTWGYAYLEFIPISPDENRVGIRYRHSGKACCYATIKYSWQELYDDLIPYLEKEGHMKAGKFI